MVKVRRAVERDRREIAACIAEGFEKDFSILCQDTGKVAEAIGGGLQLERFYVAEVEGAVAGVAAVSDCRGRASVVDGKACRRQFGLIKGLLAGVVLRGEFERPPAYPSTTGYLEFVATRKRMQRQGVATALLRGIMEMGGYQEYILDVVDTNSGAYHCYERLGFETFRREKEPHGKQKGFEERIFMRYRPE